MLEYDENEQLYYAMDTNFSITTPTTPTTTSITSTKTTTTIMTSFRPHLNHRKNLYFRTFALHRKYNIYFPYELYLSYYPLVLIIIGTIFNLASFFVMHRRNLSKYSCMRILSILALVDAFVLYQWNLNTFFKYNLSKAPGYEDLEEMSLFYCRFISYFAFSLLQISSWLLSLVSFDRLMIMYSYYWKTKISQQPQRINLLIALIFVIILTMNSHLLFKNGYTRLLLEASESNQSILQVVCYKSKTDDRYIFPKWEKAHLVLYNLMPFSVMLTCNSLIIYSIKTSESKIIHANKINKKSAWRKRRMTLMLILVTFSFILLTLPSVIVHTFMRAFLSDKPYRRLVNLCVNNLLHTSHAINFFLYVFTAPNFRKELSNIFNELISNRLRSSSKTGSGGSVNINESINQNMNNNNNKRACVAISVSNKRFASLSTASKSTSTCRPQPPNTANNKKKNGLSIGFKSDANSNTKSKQKVAKCIENEQDVEFIDDFIKIESNNLIIGESRS
jgi:hypothetical protein